MFRGMFAKNPRPPTSKTTTAKKMMTKFRLARNLIKLPNAVKRSRKEFLTRRKRKKVHNCATSSKSTRVAQPASGKPSQSSAKQTEVLMRVLNFIASHRRRIRLREQFKRFQAYKLKRQTGYVTLTAHELKDLESEAADVPVVPGTWEAWWREHGDSERVYWNSASQDDEMTAPDEVYTSPDCGIQELEKYRESYDTPPQSTEPVSFKKWFASRRARFNRRNRLEETIPGAITINHLNSEANRRHRKKGRKPRTPWRDTASSGYGRQSAFDREVPSQELELSENK